MKKLNNLFVFLMTTAILFSLSVQAAEPVVQYTRPCEDVDLCTWTPLLPLGSEDCCGCNLNYNTHWPVNTETSASCTFDGSMFQNHDLYISINNDIIECTLNGEVVFQNTEHEGCAPADPRDGYQVAISPNIGENTLVCQVKDRGYMTHFDACVVGEDPVVPAPEFPTVLIPATIALAVIGMMLALRKR